MIFQQFRRNFTKIYCFWKIHYQWDNLGIRKIHGPTDTRTLYTDLLNNIIFWKLEKYTDPIFWQFLRCHKSTRTQTHSKKSKFFMILSILLNLCRSSKMAGHFGKSDFPTPKSQKAFEWKCQNWHFLRSLQKNYFM